MGEALQDHAGFVLGLGLQRAKTAHNGQRGNFTLRYSSRHPDAGFNDLSITDVNVPSDREPRGAVLCKLGQCFSRGTARIVSRDPDLVLDLPARLEESARAPATEEGSS